MIIWFFKDEDEDNFGNFVVFMDICLMVLLMGYVINDLDCNDENLNINLVVDEICDGIDNNCDG